MCGAASWLMEKRRWWYEGGRAVSGGALAFLSGRMDCALLLVQRESGPVGDGDEWRMRLEVVAVKP